MSGSERRGKKRQKAKIRRIRREKGGQGGRKREIEGDRKGGRERERNKIGRERQIDTNLRRERRNGNLPIDSRMGSGEARNSWRKMCRSYGGLTLSCHAKTKLTTM